MGKVLLDMAMSLDGFVAGSNGEDVGLYNWYFAPAGNATVVIDELLQTKNAASQESCDQSLSPIPTLNRPGRKECPVI